MTADDDLAGLPGWAQRMIGQLAERPPTPGQPHAGDWGGNCECRECQLNYLIVAYMFLSMEPTDRALRPAEPREPAS